MNDNSICFVLGAGDKSLFPPEPKENDIVISADAGFIYACEIGLVSDYVIGDFDSLEQIPSHDNLIILNTEKDETDMLAAIKLGLSIDKKIFHIYGSLDGRFDHSLANIGCLEFLLDNGANGILFGKDYALTLIRNSSLTFDRTFSGTISVFAWDKEAEGVNLRGLKFPLTDAKITRNFPIGVSNKFMGRESTVQVKHGTVLVIFPLIKSTLPY